MESNLTCEYLDSQYQPAWWQINKCVQDPAQGLAYNCNSGVPCFNGESEKPSLMKSLAIKRGHGVGIEADGQSALASLEQGFSSLVSSAVSGSGTEGFTSNLFVTDNGLGASSVRSGACPEGYRRESGQCFQTCLGCKYNETNKSREFNEADPCFPTGVFDGYTNGGTLKCTCGKDNKYCSNRTLDPYLGSSAFTTDGLFLSGSRRQVGTIGDSDSLNSLFRFD
jgi:hypothetical protein